MKTFNSMAEKKRSIAESLLNIIKPEGTEWGDIVAAIEKEYTIGNWLTEVRGPLQYLLDMKLIQRDHSDIRKEVYRLTVIAIRV